MTLILLAVALVIGWSSCQLLTVNVTNSSINANTTYTVKVDRTAAATNWSAGSYIIIDFPSYTSSQFASVICTPTCTINGASVNISSSTFTSSQTLTVSIVHVLNPPTAKSTDPCRYRLFTANGTMLESSQFSLGSFLAGTFKRTQ